jgi:hypothetical protein
MLQWFYYKYFLVYFPYLEKIEAGLCDLHAVCVSVYPLYQLLNAWTNLYETWYAYHGNWAISVVYPINSSHQSVCLYLYPLIIARQRLGKNVTAVTKTQATIEELLEAPFPMRPM